MSYCSYGFILKISAAACLFPAFTALAEQREATEVMVVTASQRALPRSSIGSAITVITADDIQRRGGIYAADMLRQVPGFALSRSGTFGTVTNARVRGAEGNHTQVLIDGIEANDPSTDSAFNFGSLTLDNVERIEIIRGPQSALSGSDAIGAVVHIITRRGQGAFSLRGNIEGGAFDTVKTSIGSAAGNEYINYNINAEVLSTNGINVARTGTEDDGHHNRTYDLKLGIDPSDILNLDFIVRHVNTDTDTDPQPFPSPVITDAPGNKTIIERTYLKGGLGLSLLDGRWQHGLSVASTGTRNQFESSNFGRSFNNGRRVKYAYKSNFNFDTPGIHTSRHASFLFEYQDETARGSFVGGRSRVGFISRSYAGEYHTGLYDLLFVTAGIRFDDNEFFDNAATYRVASAYKFRASDMRLHASYGKGIKNPTISELFGNFPTFSGNPDLQPESSIGWDAGIEMVWMDGRLLVDTTYFNNAITDQITGFVFSGGNTVANNSSTNHIYGLETTLDYVWNPRLTLSGVYTYTDANDQELIRRARHIASFNLNYSFLDNRANINLGVHYNGEQEDYIFGNRRTRTTLDDFTLVNVNASYRINNAVSVYARVENIFDDDYEEVYSYRAPGIGGFAGIKLNLNP